MKTKNTNTFDIRTLTPIEMIFQEADNSQATFATRLIDLGIYTKAEAIPHIVAFVEKKYGIKAKQGQRGITFEKDTAPHSAYKRIVNNCFEPEVNPDAKPKTSNRTDPVDALITKFTKLSKAEQKRFLASIA